MDADTLLRALGHSEKARLFVEVMLLEARLREESGDPLRGQQLRDKAANLLARIETPRA